MSIPRVIMVHLRQPRRGNPDESRADPFFELGSFGCTKCHSRNLMHPRKAQELEGARFAFAQGGPGGFRLVHLTPPARVVEHRDRCELTWSPVDMPFRYDSAPVLVDREGHTDFPALMIVLRRILRTTWPARFSSAFRSRRKALPADVAEELIRVYGLKRAGANSASVARSYVDSLPYPPNNSDTNRERTLNALRAKAMGRNLSRKKAKRC